jgi:serine protease Do
MIRRRPRIAELCALAALLLVPALLRAADAPAATAPAAPASILGSSNPRDVEELRAIQQKVEAVVKKNLSATVGIAISGGQGSGVIVSKDGLVLTAGHVSGPPGSNCRIILPDGKTYHAKSLGHDSRYDAGMIRIVDKAPDAGWPSVEIGASAKLETGQWTVALGHPGGYHKERPPVARLGRVLASAPGAVATDNTIINGDSGGPLFDLSGKLIGIHSRIGASSSENIHVPIDTFTLDWDRLVAGESWGNSLLGIDNNTSSVVLGITVIDSDSGCRISRVNDNSAAARAGLKVGDIITRFNNRDVKTPAELVNLMARQRPGRSVTLAIIRNEKPIEVTTRPAIR